jgi:uncharacterized protein (TIGR02217 family)
MQFLEERLGELIVQNTVGGPGFQTDVIRSRNGREQRNGLLDHPLGSWELGERMVQAHQLEHLLTFMRRVRGKLIGFRFQDWGDYRVKHEQGRVVLIDDKRYLVKRYADDVLRRIHKPNAGIEIKSGANVVEGTVDTATGELILAPGASSTNLTWAGTFDVPVRFDVDQIKYSLNALDRETGVASFRVYSLPVVELAL